MKQWKDLMVYPALRPKLQPPPICSFCGREIGVDEPERRFWPMSLTEDERSRIRPEFRLSKPEEEFGLCEKCFVKHARGEYYPKQEHGRATEDIYETPDDWAALVVKAHFDAYPEPQVD